MSEQPEQTFVALQSRTTGEWLAHPDLRPQMIADAQEKGTSLTDLTVRILCERLGVAYTPNVRKSEPEGEKRHLQLRLPDDLERALGAEYGSKKAHGIRSILCAHYGLSLPPRTKRRRNRTPATA